MEANYLTEQDIDDAIVNYDQMTWSDLLDKYESELDWELNEDIRKAMRYVILRENGTKPQWAKMTACRRTARYNGSDQAFCRAARERMESTSPELTKRRMIVARNAGIDVANKYYEGSLGKPNNPDAWVTGIQDVIDVVKRRNLPCEGLVNHKPVDLPVQETPLADDIRDELVQKRLEGDPALRQKAARDARVLRELRQAVVAQHGRRPTKTPKSLKRLLSS